MSGNNALIRAAELIERLLYSGRDEIYDASDADDICASLREMAATDQSAIIAELERERDRLQSNLKALEDEKNTYIDYVGDALGQGEDESLWDAAQRVLSDRDRLREALRRWLGEWDTPDSIIALKRDTAETLKK